jgi:hypothetical protein
MDEDGNSFMLKKFYINIELKGLPKGGNFRGNWYAKYAENAKWANKIKEAVGNNIPKAPIKRVKLTYTRCSCSCSGDQPGMDWDNLVISFKPIQDALVTCGILENDTINNIPDMPIYKQEIAKRGDGKIRVELWEI